MPTDVCGKDTLDGLSHTLRQVRERLKGAVIPVAESVPAKASFDRNVYHREYMRGYMRKRRAAKRGE